MYIHLSHLRGMNDGQFDRGHNGHQGVRVTRPLARCIIHPNTFLRLLLFTFSTIYLSPQSTFLCLLLFTFPSIHLSSPPFIHRLHYTPFSVSFYSLSSLYTFLCLLLFTFSTIHLFPPPFIYFL